MIEKQENKPRICQFNDAYFPIMDGPTTVSHNYAKWLSEKGCKSSLVALGTRRKTDLNYNLYFFKSIPLPSMKPYRIGLPSIDSEFKKQMKNVKFDLVHSHAPFISGHIALDIAKKQHIPLVTTFHTKYKEDFKKVVKSNLIVNLLLKYIINFYNKADSVWVPSESTGKTLAGYGFKGKYEVMPNGCDLQVNDKQIKEYRERSVKNKIRDKKDEFVMLFVGQHRWEKNVRLMLEAFNILKKQGENFKMIFVGEGYARKDMERIVRDFNLENNVRFAGVIRDREKLKEFYAASDLYIFPSIYDTSPLTVQEAAAFYVPSILIEGSSAADPIINDSNGFTTKNNPADFASKIRSIMHQPKLMKKVGNNAKKTVYHTWEEAVERARKRYIQIIEEHNKKKHKISA